jgi:transcription elongation factor B subunit 1
MTGGEYKERYVLEGWCLLGTIPCNYTILVNVYNPWPVYCSFWLDCTTIVILEKKNYAHNHNVTLSHEPSRQYPRANGCSIHISAVVMSEEERIYVKLVSAEGHEFFLDRSIAMAGSSTIRTMLEGQFREAQDNVITFPDIAGYILERVIRYLHYKTKFTNVSARIPEFLIEPEYALELLIAAKYLDC